MEQGFFHPDIGYWQTLNKVTDDQREKFPAGTIEIPVKPGEYFQWSGNEWVPIDPPPLSLEKIDALRKLAYEKEADPLFFKWQRGEATQQEWIDKIAEIRIRYPDPV